MNLFLGLYIVDVVNNILQTNERFVVPVTAAEFEVMRTAFSVCHDSQGFQCVLCSFL